MTLQEVQRVARFVEQVIEQGSGKPTPPLYLPELITRLVKGARTLSRFYTEYCNWELTEHEWKRVRATEKGIAEVAEWLGFEPYFQRDPRGMPVYVVSKTTKPEDVGENYISGVCVPI